MADTFEESDRAWVSSSSEVLVSDPLVGSTTTQMLATDMRTPRGL
jgi:hypothetical protein